MASYKFIEHKFNAADAPTATGTAQLWPLGMTAGAVAYGTGSADSQPFGYAEFVYCAGSNAGTAGNLVCFPGYTASVMSAALSASKFPLGFAAGPLSATNVYGWVQVKGVVTNACGTNADIAAGVPMYLHAGAGQVASAVVNGNQILGLHVFKSATSNLAAGSSLTLQCEHPKVVGLSASI